MSDQVGSGTCDVCGGDTLYDRHVGECLNRKDLLDALDALLVLCGVRPGDLMSLLRGDGVTNGLFLHELTDDQLREQVRSARRVVARMPRKPANVRRMKW